jgi:hypothetical protein
VTRTRLVAIVCLAAVVPLGFGLKFYPGPGHAWVNNSLGGTAYVIFWCLLFFVAWPRRSAINPIVIGVLVATAALEALQLVNHPILAGIRGTFIGRTIIGTTFVWSDYIYYVLGAVLGRLLLAALCRLEETALRAEPVASNETTPPSGSAGRTS